MKLHVIFFVLLFLVFAPVFVSAQNADTELETQIRTALQAQADVEGLSESEFDSLVAAMIVQAEKVGLDAAAIEASFAPTQTEEYGEAEEYAYDEIGSIQASQTEGSGVIPAVLGVLVLLVLLFFVWKKMEHGGAMGASQQ